MNKIDNLIINIYIRGVKIVKIKVKLTKNELEKIIKIKEKYKIILKKIIFF